MKNTCLEIINDVIRFGLENSDIQKNPRKPYWVIDDSFSLNYDFIDLIEEAEQLYETEESKKVFRWHLYSVLLQGLYKRMDLTERLCSDPYTVEEEELDTFVSELKKNEKGIYSIDEYQIQSHKGLIKETWGARSYILDSLFDLENCTNIIDGGAYKGETAIWFAKEAPNSRIYAFEIQKEIQRDLHENIKRNGLSERINVISKGLWNCSTVQKIVLSDVTSNLEDANEGGHQDIQTITIDNYVVETGLDSVDYIKLDIEGSEENAILGATETIKKNKPILAVAMYHKISDIYKIPLLIKGINPNYKFYLSKKMKGNGEIILFCV